MNTLITQGPIDFTQVAGSVIDQIPSGPQRRLAFETAYVRQHVVSNYQFVGTYVYPEHESIEFVHESSPSDVYLAVTRDGNWRLAADLRVRSGSIVAERPVAFAALTGSGQAYDLRIESAGDIQIRAIGQPATSASSIVFAVGTDVVKSVPGAVPPPVFDIDKERTSRVHVIWTALAPVHLPWAFDGLAIQANGPLPAVQTLGYGPLNDANQDALVYATAAGLIRLFP